jgi:hypothetical protein
MDGGLPTKEYKSIEVSIGERKILLPKNALRICMNQVCIIQR